MVNYINLLKRFPKEKGVLLDIIREIQHKERYVPKEAIQAISEYLDISEADVRGVATFYHFFSLSPRGQATIYLNNSITSWMAGHARVAQAFEEEAGCKFGEVSLDGKIGLFPTACVGFNDQEPAAIVNGVVFIRLTPDKARSIVRGLRDGRSAESLVEELNQKEDQSFLVFSMFTNNIQYRGPIIFAPFKAGSVVNKIVQMTPDQVIEEIKNSGLLGRGGAGFPTGLKWEFCRKNEAVKRFVVCNADEGEPGTFKDRVILTELPHVLFEGMAVAGYAIGAEEGILYLRYEYSFLKSYLENILAELREKKVLGREIALKPDFNFDIKIKLGAGAYVCGEESALLESAEGKRGEPRDRPPYPVSVGYLGQPTSVNNVETLTAAAQILLHGANWFKYFGTMHSTGTKLLSVSGDCRKPGIYEIEFGTTLSQLLKIAGAQDASFVQVGGPSGICVPSSDFDRKIAFEDLATGGSIIIFGPKRSLFDVVHNFMEFFVEESCGHCTPCRVGNYLLMKKFEKIIQGRAAISDLQELETLGKLIKATSRCGLGQTSPNPILTTIQNFKDVYLEKININKDISSQPDFDFFEALKPGLEIAGRNIRAEFHHE